MTSIADIFERDRYVVLNNLLEGPSLAQLYRYACKMAQSGYMPPGDEQVPGTPCGYRDFFMEGLLITLLPQVERASGLSLFPTYSYFRVYKQGDVLARHTDRPSCEVSVTLCLGFEGDKPWPILIEGPQGVSSVEQSAGDALVYRGTECAHWRETLEGQHHAQVFLHYVDQNGPHAEWKFDKKTAEVRLV